MNDRTSQRQLEANRRAIRVEFSDNPEQMAREIEARRHRLVVEGHASYRVNGSFKLEPRKKL